MYKSIAPNDIAKQISAATNCKVPHFFIYAKDKTLDQVEPRGKSPVDRLVDIIPKYRFRFNAKVGGKFDYHMLMDNPNLIKTPHVEFIIQQYDEKISNLTRIYLHDEPDEKLPYQFQVLREEMLALATNEKYVVDAIILGIFFIRKSSHKGIFWDAFGDIVLENLKKNLSKQCAQMTLCSRCYSRFEPTDQYAKCPVCGTKHQNVRTGACIDCGEEFLVDSRNMTKIRCAICQREVDRRNTLKRVARFRGV